jgi:hypothetical protein
VTVEHPLPDGVPGVSSTPPRDLDADGCYEAVDGDGRFDFLDVVELLFELPRVASRQPRPAVDRRPPLVPFQSVGNHHREPGRSTSLLRT